MAPPPPRRGGYSRRAQYGLFAGYVVAVAGTIFGLFLVITSWVDPEGHSALRRMMTDVTAPISSAGSSVVGGAKGAGGGLSGWWRAGTQNASLKKELDAARRELIDARSLKRENEALRKTLGIIERDGRPVAMGRLVASSPSSSRRFGIINVGSTSGVANEQSVRSADGLFGRVIETGIGSARILLITDSGNVVPVRRVSDGLPAIVTGIGDGWLEVRPLTSQTGLMKPGDVFVTSGVGGIYQPNIPVTVIRKSQRDKAYGVPIASPGASDVAMVLPVYEPAATDAAVAQAAKPPVQAGQAK